MLHGATAEAIGEAHLGTTMVDPSYFWTVDGRNTDVMLDCPRSLLSGLLTLVQTPLKVWAWNPHGKSRAAPGSIFCRREELVLSHLTFEVGLQLSHL